VFSGIMPRCCNDEGFAAAYNKDMQEDKEALFDTVDTVKMCLSVAGIVFENLSVNEFRTLEAASTGYMNATELADYLVRKGMPFRTAHDVTGKIVLRRSSFKMNCTTRHSKKCDLSVRKSREDVFDALSLERTIASKSQTGGTSREQVAIALDKACKYLNE
jgi:argininosuccinate lyase